MHFRILAVGDRQPAWVDDAVDTYVARLPRTWRIRIDTLPTAKRARNEPGDRARDAEGEAILARTADDYLVLLDERGRDLSSTDLARKLEDWQQDGRDLTFVIGGPDGVSDAVKSRADFSWSLSRLTLPHGIARILLSEQLYRAWSLNTGHPYHRA